MGALISSILALLREIPELKFCTIWNNQFAYMEDGGSYSFPTPCAFAELTLEDNGQIGGLNQGSDFTLTVHIGQNMINGSLMDENLTIFDLRDLVVKKLSLSGLMTKQSETQDFNHSNIYHYQIVFKAHWIDTTAAPTEYWSGVPTNLIVTKI